MGYFSKFLGSSAALMLMSATVVGAAEKDPLKPRVPADQMGDAKAMNIEVVQTGCLSLDIALGIGGVPRGRTVEIFHRLDKTTYADPAVVRRAQGFVAVKVNTEGSRRELEVAAKYGVRSLPTILFLSPQGRQLFRVNGFQGPGQFPRTLDVARHLGERVIAWEASLEADARDAAAALGLGRHLYEQEYFEEAQSLLRTAVAHDSGASIDERREARMLLAILAQVTRDFAEAERLVKEALQLGPDPDEQPRLLFVLGRTYVSAGRQEEGVATFEVIVRQFPQGPMAQKAKETLTTLRSRR